jgi:tRNA A37 threonylcarbamoyladenosine synthetase subunit TsaC/SUA5/YrdC
MDVPLAQTSANIGGEKTPYSLSDITIETNREKLTNIAVMVDAGILPSRPPSTVVDASGDSFKIIRQGDLIIEV